MQHGPFYHPFSITISGFLVMIFLFASQSLFSQTFHPQSPDDAILTGNEKFMSSVTLKFPWAGGLNACQFCPIELNGDGLQDLLVFDRHGNRKLTFINHGTADKIDYTWQPEYAEQLPDMHDWVLTADYNCDGKMDIFTYGYGGVRVFKNISGSTPEFTLVTDLLTSFYYIGKVGILVTSVDYPALADIDNDGDLDLLTFFGLGSYLEYHQNLSKEKYGHCDSLDFRLADPCWGKFKESEGGNKITLNAPCETNDQGMQNAMDQTQKSKTRHTGSTLLATDLNNDGLKDLILGDVDYPGLIALINGGTIDSAVMVSQDTLFPGIPDPVHLFSFPVVSLLDIDNDGLRDLLVSPFDPSLYTSDNYDCVWFYKNTGSNALPAFKKQPYQPFRNEMMDFGSASHPVLYDFDGDGLTDLLTGNYGTYDSSYYYQTILHSVYNAQIAYFRNTGTGTSPVFSFVTDDLAGITALGIQGAFPAPGDLNGDGHTDLLVGNRDGTLMLYINTGKTGAAPGFLPPEMFWQSIDVGAYSTPQLFDLDKDNLPELIIGEQNGNLNLYKNTGTITNPNFTLITDSLGKVNVTNYAVSYDGFSTPCFNRRPDGTTFLLVGSEEGRIHLFENIDENLAGKFTDTAGLYSWLSANPADTLFGWQTSPTIGSLTDPGAFDMITGNFSGGFNYISKRMPAGIIPGLANQDTKRFQTLSVTPNPANQTVTVTLPTSVPRVAAAYLLVFNHYGQEVLKIPFDGNATFPVGHLAPGLYFLRLNDACARLIVSHN